MTCWTEASNRGRREIIPFSAMKYGKGRSSSLFISSWQNASVQCSRSTTATVGFGGMSVSIFCVLLTVGPLSRVVKILKTLST